MVSVLRRPNLLSCCYRSYDLSEALHILHEDLTSKSIFVFVNLGHSCSLSYLLLNIDLRCFGQDNEENLGIALMKGWNLNKIK